MNSNLHQFHIPVMGTGHSIDSPARVAHLGIDSVVSIVDDLLCEKIRKYYSELCSIPYENIGRSTEDGRARRITAYLDTMHEVVQAKFDEIKAMPLFENSEKDRYFNLLPDDSSLKKAYEFIATLGDADVRQKYIDELTEKMRPGAIDVNIMAKVDALKNDKSGKPLSQEFSDASAALRGFANSVVSSSVVLSAGYNPRLYNYISEFQDFYRSKSGHIKKKIILKVSDFRSALIQGKILAKKGLEVAEFRIESGLNCGGHAFATDGFLLPVILKEFKDKKAQLIETFQPMVQKYYEANGWEYPSLPEAELQPKITVQGGIGTSGEQERLLSEYDLDGTGWGTPFLLVPEATCVDDTTSKLLADAEEKDLYLSGVSPLGVPFNNVRNSGSDRFTKDQIKNGKPGSKCPKAYLVSNTEFTEEPICTASAEYQILKINQIENSDVDAKLKERHKAAVLEKTCLCTNLGTSSLIRLGLMKESYGRQEVCPGPNIAWFTRSYGLDEMVNHIYGRIPSLVSEQRPHMFAKELRMYVDYISERTILSEPGTPDWRKLEKMKKNLLEGMEYLMEISESKLYGDENLSSLAASVIQERERLESIFSEEVIA